MKKIYLSFLIVFVVLAALFTVSRNLTSGIIDTALIAAGEGSNIQIDKGALEAEKKRKKRTPAKIAGASGMASAALMCASREKTLAPPVTKLAKNAEKQKFKKNLFVLDWAILGPFTNLGEGTPFTSARALSCEFLKDEANLTVATPLPEGLSWQTASSLSPDGKVTPSDLFKKLKGKAAFYALAEVEFDQDYPDATLWIGGREDVKVWMDGKEIFAFNPKTPRRVDAAKVRMNLTKGRHTILVKCAYNSWQSYFYIRFTDSGDVPVTPVRQKAE